MSEPQYFFDFKLGKKYLSDFGGVIYNKENNQPIQIAPEIKHTTLSLPNKDGSLYYGSTYSERIMDIPVYFEGDIDIQELSSWLCSSEEQMFSFVEDDKEIPVVFNGKVSLSAYYDGIFKGMLDISFIAHDPYYHIINERPITIANPVINEERNIKSKGNVDSMPTIKVTPIGTQSKIRFKWNDMVVVLQNITKPIYIDSENDDVYEYSSTTKISRMEKYFSNDYYDFPILEPYKANKITLIEGNLESIEITPNSRII